MRNILKKLEERYSNVYKVSEVEALLKRAIKAGYSPTVTINGEVYEVK